MDAACGIATSLVYPWEWKFVLESASPATGAGMVTFNVFVDLMLK
jgi:hypothetical protein